jgi:hypothetical protein
LAVFGRGGVRLPSAFGVASRERRIFRPRPDAPQSKERRCRTNWVPALLAVAAGLPLCSLPARRPRRCTPAPGAVSNGQNVSSRWIQICRNSWRVLGGPLWVSDNAVGVPINNMAFTTLDRFCAISRAPPANRMRGRWLPRPAGFATDVTVEGAPPGAPHPISPRGGMQNSGARGLIVPGCTARWSVS